MLTKDQLPQRIVNARTILRPATAEDFSELSAWPGYPWPFDVMDLLEGAADATGPLWWQRLGEPDRCQYSLVSIATDEIIGIYVLRPVDWSVPAVGNMGIRIRSDLMDQGYGTEAMSGLLRELFAVGIKSVRLDVAAWNPRAIRCYEKCGLRITGETWKDHRLIPPPDDPKWAFAGDHVGIKDGRPGSRHYWMEIHADDT